MTRRMKLILTRPSDDSLEAFVNFKQMTTLKSTKNKNGLLLDDLKSEWQKFWEFLNIRSNKKNNQIIRVN